jgi:hypothetical protein
MAASDRSLLRMALEPGPARDRVTAAVADKCEDGAHLELDSARVVKQRPGRRAVIAYHFVKTAPPGPGRPLVVFGKLRMRGTDARSQRVLEALWNAGLKPGGERGVEVPEPLALIPELHMTLQRGVAGCPIGELLYRPEAPRLMGQVAGAIQTLHATKIETHRSHSLDDELAILRKGLAEVTALQPQWGPRLESVLDACEQLAETLANPRRAGVHRDFHPDQLMVEGTRLTLLDFDLYARGDPALDVGNFAAHLTELALRQHGDPAGLVDCEEALFEGYQALREDVSRRDLEGYATLSLVRHISISSARPDRKHATSDLLALCEERLASARS